MEVCKGFMRNEIKPHAPACNGGGRRPAPSLPRTAIIGIATCGSLVSVLAGYPSLSGGFLNQIYSESISRGWTVVTPRCGDFQSLSRISVQIKRLMSQSMTHTNATKHT